MKRVVERELGHLFSWRTPPIRRPVLQSPRGSWRTLFARRASCPLSPLRLAGELLDAAQVHRPGQCRLAPDLTLRAVQRGALFDGTDAQRIARRIFDCRGIDR